MSEAVLIVDDDPIQRRLLQGAVEKLGHAALAAENGSVALDLLGRAEPHPRAMILDLMMPGMDGIEVLHRMRDRGHAIPVIVQTSKGSIDTAVEAMRAGAFDFIVKPVAPARLGTAIGNALKVAALESRERNAKRPASDYSFNALATNSAAMRRVIELGRKAAATDIPILIEGESGVGKELIARAIQAAGERRRKPFITVNCGAIPDTLVESILFGHEKGAFTGATEKHTGKFVEADTGTLFLDEIGDLPLSVQVKLLRAVQQGEVDPVGGRGTRRVDIRLISATNHDLISRVKEGRFREDLFYRLNVFPIMVPPLRDRKEDIPLLVQGFIARFAPEHQNRITGIRADALQLLADYDWPGNIRQLENAVLRAVVLCDRGMLGKEDFPQIRAQVEGIDPDTGAAGADRAAPASGAFSSPISERVDPAEASALPKGLLRAIDENDNIRPLEAIEGELIRLAIEHYEGQMSEVARRLGIGRSTLYRKLKEMGIEPAEKMRAVAARSSKGPF
ncbi:sigma-54 dependent transcriptional regulator [Nitratireductor sp. ZSWI3]|uniref:sigma-54-dependent transcriptional regulator n=1 Tax=Nitratireductor sp. ZSWI3 TaxID=2966359 RepID=UPI00214FCF3D|nr:sigma-54 dependent transcriptional regulator [Nitratireductor sp. ZSWI3]MCR4264989.1 sigma-54 dependent transcriptional regulator [Nitratireductor sp. ZSWI3]